MREMLPTSSIEEDLGYIKGQLQSVEQRIMELDKENELLAKKLDEVRDQLAMYRHFIIWARSTLAVGILVLTLKFGDIAELFGNLFGKGSD